MIGKNIHQLRTQNGITLSELAERAGISKSYLSSIERNLKQNPSIQVMEKIALVLQVDLKNLLQLNGGATKPTVTEESPDQEFLDLMHELHQAGMGKEDVRNYKILMEFIKWQSEQCKT
jgi:XRE family transcriptional regulator of biofilm formation